MSAIEASSVGVRTMADGTLRLTVDIEPRHAQDAFKLFGAPGTPMALAALKVATHEPEKADKPKGGLLSQWAAMRCQEPAFQDWLAETYPTFWQDNWGHMRPSKANAAAQTVRDLCGINSRAELDTDDKAREAFDQRIRAKWQKHCIATGAAA